MNIINKIIPSLLIASSLTYADLSIDSVGLNLGYAHIDAKQVNKSGTITLANDPDEQYLHGELYALIGGAFEDKSFKASINYMHSRNDEFVNNTIMMGVNRYFFLEDYSLYAGVLIGVGRLDWKYSPINGTKDNYRHVESLVGALQVGAEYQLTESLSLGFNAKYQVHDYSTALEPITGVEAEINHQKSSSIAIGVRFKI